MKVIVTDYRSEWASLYLEEAAKIVAIFGEELSGIHHIGSTAVPGLEAKPVIDILPVVNKIDKVDRFNHEMIRHGYEPLGEFGIKGRRFFKKGGLNRTHHVHIFDVSNTYEIERHVAVRDYLRTYPKLAKAYGKLKAELALKYPSNIEAYMLGKDAFVKNLEQMALQWKREQP